VEIDHHEVHKYREDHGVHKPAMTKSRVGPNDLIGLTFQGEKKVLMKRSVLCQVEGSKLAAMFSGHYEDNLELDKDGNVYFNYPPAVMMPLMDWLTVLQDLAPDAELPTINIPEGYGTVWDGAVKFFGLESVMDQQKSS